MNEAAGITGPVGTAEAAVTGRKGRRLRRAFRRTTRRQGAVAGALVLLGVVAAACGGASASPGVASIGSTTTTTTSPAGASGGGFPNRQALATDALNFAQCMRTHGVPNFPEPIIGAPGGSAGQGSGKVAVRLPNNANTPAFRKAQATCRHYLPNGGQPPSPAQRAALEARLLEFAKCMRTHGVPGFPDPQFNSSGGGFSIRIGGPGEGIDRSTPQFQAAQKTCRPLLGGALGPVGRPVEGP